jgi:hypothetical protein
MAAEERYAKPLAYERGRLVRTIDEPIRVGSVLWVFTDPHRGYEFPYNRWYERDHYYGGCMIGAWNIAGSRWVATKRHKDARLPDVPDMPFGRDDGSYACLYFLLDGHHDDWLEWSTPQVHALYAADRGFEHRTHYNTAFYRYRWRAYRDPDPIPLELAPDHRFAGMVAMFVEPRPGIDDAALDAWFDGVLPDWFAGSPVASTSSWSYVPPPDAKPDFVPVDPKAAQRHLMVFFVDEDPLGAWDRFRDLSRRADAEGVARVVFASPFVKTNVGTDDYVDELW